jgi:uncharacterized delta-60 repeat protein
MNIKKNSKNIFSVDGKIILTVFFGFLLAVQIYAQPGRLDLNFKNVLAPGAEVNVIETALDGKILVAGKITTRGGVVRREIVRLNADGSLDPTFDFGTANPNIRIKFMKALSDGKILIAGDFAQVNGVYSPGVARLNTDGSVDTSFQSAIEITFVYDFVIQADGKILVSGVNSIGWWFVRRLNANGSLDATFDGAPYSAVAFVPAENKILIGAREGSSQRRLRRIGLDGQQDTVFSAVVTGVENNFYMKPLADGKIVIWGKFETVNGVVRPNLAILNNDGSLYETFNPAIVSLEVVNAVAAQPNGKIIVGFGNSLSPFYIAPRKLVRFNANGTVDTTFNQGKGPNNAVKALKIRSNGKLLIGGTFFRYHIFPRSGLAQIQL